MPEQSVFGSMFTNKEQTSVPTGAGGAGFSPFMNLDPRLIQENDNYILPEGAGHQRGKFEKAFSQIGASIFTGAAVGGVSGLYAGVKDVRAKGLMSNASKTQILNVVGKQGGAYAQVFGTIAFLFSALDTSLSLMGSPNEDVNTVISGSTTGMITGLKYRPTDVKNALI
ncbi:mitochondrial import inner membrane translocase [Mactra antiquata]